MQSVDRPSKLHERPDSVKYHLPLILTVGHLRKAGLFRKGPQTRTLNIGAPILVETETGDTFFITVPKYLLQESESVLFKDSRLFVSHTIETSKKKIHFGDRPYFICPQTGDLCLKLVFFNSLASSIPAFHLIKSDARVSKRALIHESRRQRFLKQDGSLRIRRDEQERLLGQLVRNSRQLQHDSDILEFLDRRERKQQRERAKFLRESKPNSTTKGLDVGKGAAQDNAYFEFLRMDDNWFETIEPPKRPAERPTRARREDYPALDMRVLLDRDVFKHEGLTAIRMGWPEESMDWKRVYMFIDCRGPGLPQLIFRFDDLFDQQMTWQVVEMLASATSDKPRYLLCPITRARSEILYLRNGFFASPAAHQLKWDDS